MSFEKKYNKKTCKLNSILTTCKNEIFKKQNVDEKIVIELKKKKK
jgi:hypothetical protein